MNLSLEVKRFMNNEHMGDYVSVVLPSELPVERAEVREVNRDRSAAHSARSLAENKAKAAAKARDRAENTSKLLTSKRNELESQMSVLDEIVSQQRAMQPELDSKKRAYEDAYSDYEEKRNLYEVKRESYVIAENSYNAAVDAEKAAVLVLNDCRANYSSAETALASAKEDGARHEGRLSSSMSEAAELKVLAENARGAAREASRLEAEKRAQYNELYDRTAQLLAIMKAENKKLSDAQKALASALKEYSRAMSDHSAAKEALNLAEKAVVEAKGDTESLKAKVTAQRSKLAAAAARLDTAESNKASAEAEVSAAEQAASKATIDYNKMNELLTACKAELDTLSSRSAQANSSASEAEASYSSVSSSFEKSRGDVESNVRDVKNLEAGLVSSKKLLLNAESDVDQRHEEVAAARRVMESAKLEMDEYYTSMKRSEAIFNSKKTAYDKINSEYQLAEKDRRAQRVLCDKLSNDIRQLEIQLENDNSIRDSAVAEAEDLEAEAERKRLSVRTINTKYETVKIHFMQQGKGEDLILIHSVGQSLYTFRDLVSKLSGKFRVTALDLVGFGYSEKPYYFNYTLDEMGDFLDRFMEAMGIDYAHFFGFSMGAGYVINFAKRYPDRVGKIVLLSPGGITPEMPSSVRSVSNRIFGGIAARLLSYKSVKKMLSECFFDLTNHTDDLCEEYYKPIASPEAKRVIRSCVACYDDEEVIRSLRDVAADTLILWGSEDKWHPTEMSDLFRSVMPKVEYKVIRNSGHLAHEEKPDRTAQLIKMFIPCGYDEQEEETTFN